MAVPAITNPPDAVPETSVRRRGLLSVFAFQSNLARSGKYRADVDGLRALAVLSVLFYHAKLFACGGGYVGVDVFYVISGYLITTLIAKDIEEGRFSFVSFYERRMRRIFPALFGVLFFCVLAASVIFIPRDLVQFGKSLVAATAFASNIFFWRGAMPQGYFSTSATLLPLLHTWSLSVEEQFYLVYPALLLLLYRWAKRHIGIWLAFFAAATFCLNLWATPHRPAAAFYLSVPRAWELLIGSLLAIRAVPPLRSRILREMAGLAGLGMIVAAVFLLSDLSPFPGYDALLPCIGTGLLIWSGEQGSSSLKSALSFRPLVFIGIISYSLYLWHWPLLVFARYFAAGELTGPQKAGVLLCSAILAFVSFESIERPFRGSRSSFSRRRVFQLGLAASAATVAAGLAMMLTHGLPQRYSQNTRRLIAANSARTSDYDEACGNFRTEVRSMADITFCSIGSGQSGKILFWGDSHIGQLMPAVRSLDREGELGGQSALFAIEAGCMPSERVNSLGGYHCDSFAKFAMMRAEQPDIHTVFIGFNTWWSANDGAVCLAEDRQCRHALSPQEADRVFLADLTDEIRTLRAYGKRVILCLPFPMYDKSIPELEMRDAVFGRFGLSGVASDFTLPAVRAQLIALAASAGAEIYDPRASLCPAGHCITEIGGVSIYIDSHHLAESQVGILDQGLAQVLR